MSLVYLSQGIVDDLCLHTVQLRASGPSRSELKGHKSGDSDEAHLISRDNKLKTLTREKQFNKLASVSGEIGAFSTQKQSIKVNDPAIHGSVTAERRCINRRTYRLVKLRSSPRPHSIPGLSWERGSEVLVAALINKFVRNGEINRRC